MVGAGFTVSNPDPQTETCLQDFWTHHFNRMGSRLIELWDKLTRSGKFIVLISTDAGSASYLRVVPTFQIEEITTNDNDIEHVLLIDLPVELLLPKEKRTSKAKNSSCGGLNKKWAR